MSIRWHLHQDGPRQILMVTPQGEFIRGEGVTDEEYLEALELYNEMNSFEATSPISEKETPGAQV